MGVPQFLSQVLPVAGRRVDLRDYRDGVVIPPVDDEGMHRSTDSDDDGSGGDGNSVGTMRYQGGGERRPLRIGLDISTWIYKACVGHGDMLADERHLSNYGRAALHQDQQKQIQRQQQQQQEQPSDVTGSNAKAPSTINNANDANVDVAAAAAAVQQQQPLIRHDDEEAVTRYVVCCTKSVTDKILILRDGSCADILVVLDGASPPIKCKETRERSRKRKEAERTRDEPVDLTGNMEAEEKRIRAFKRSGAGKYYQRVIANMILSLRENHIPFLVSPYESDGQLAFLALEHYIDLIITEDSDLIAYGAKAAPILYKLSDHISQGKLEGMMLRYEDLAANQIRRTGSSQTNNLDLSDFTPVMLTVLFVCIGSDYCTKLQGIGIIGACKIVRKAFFDDEVDEFSSRARNHRNDYVVDNRSPLEKVFERLFQDTWEKSRLTQSRKEEFKQEFMAAVLMYRHPVVYDPVERRCRVLGESTPDRVLTASRPYKKLCEDMEQRTSKITGPIIKSPVSTYIAEGWISPITKEALCVTSDKIPDCVQEYLAKIQRRTGTQDTNCAAQSDKDVSSTNNDDDNSLASQSFTDLT